MKRLGAIACTLLALSFAATVSWARILRVPVEYANIQTAMDSSAVWDTVLVAPGDYAEFLHGPQHSIVILGEQPPDSNGSVLTRLDPSLLPGSDTLTIFTAQSDTSVLKNLVFVNGPEMRTEELPTHSGGILNHASFLTLDHCVFDSVRNAVQGGQRITVNHSIFMGCVAYCLLPEPTARVTAEESSFDGRGFWLISASSESRFERCRFESWGSGTDLLHLHGSNITVTECTFGPRTGAFPAISIYSLGNCEISHNAFVGIRDCVSIIECLMDCPGPEGSPFVIRHNHIEDFHPNLFPLGASRAIYMSCQDFAESYWGIVENNIIRDGSCGPGGAIPSPGINGGPAYYEGNTLSDLSPSSLPDMRLASWSQTDTTVLRENRFEPPGTGLTQQGVPADARWNWWGDSTGPYNGSLNPSGQGAEVGNGIEFIPWLTDTTSSAIEPPHIATAESYALSAFPNPFNSQTQIRIAVPRRGDYSLTLYDVTGRKVRDLFRDTIEREASVAFDARDLPSGVYFAKLTNTRASETLSAEKIVLMR